MVIIKKANMGIIKKGGGMGIIKKGACFALKIKLKLMTIKYENF